MSDAVESEIWAATQFKFKKGESRSKYLGRMLDAVEALPNESWNDLSLQTRHWFNTAAETYKNAGNNPDSIPEFEEVGDPPPEDVPTPVAEEEPVEEVEVAGEPEEIVEVEEVVEEETAPPPRRPAAEPTAPAKTRARSAAAAPAKAPAKALPKALTDLAAPAAPPKAPAAPPARKAAVPPAPPAKAPAPKAPPAPPARKAKEPPPAPTATPGPAPTFKLKLPEGNGRIPAVSIVRHIMIQNPQISMADLVKEVKKAGGAATDLTISSTRSEFRHTVRLLKEYGHLQDLHL